MNSFCLRMSWGSRGLCSTKNDGPPSVPWDQYELRSSESQSTPLSCARFVGRWPTKVDRTGLIQSPWMKWTVVQTSSNVLLHFGIRLLPPGRGVHWGRHPTSKATIYTCFVSKDNKSITFLELVCFRDGCDSWLGNSVIQVNWQISLTLQSLSEKIWFFVC